MNHLLSPIPLLAKQPAAAPLPDPTYAVIDTETGGLKCRSDALLSVGCVLTDGSGNQHESYHQGVQPFVPIGAPDNEAVWHIWPEPGLTVTDEAVKVNGYTRELWAERRAVSERQALYLLHCYLGTMAPAKKLTFVAFNAPFDHSFLYVADVRHHHHAPWRNPNEWICAKRMLYAWRVYTNTPGACHLKDLATLAGYDLTDHHHAATDARACAAGFRWLLAEQARLEIDLIAAQNLLWPENYEDLKQFTGSEAA